MTTANVFLFANSPYPPSDVVLRPTPAEGTLTSVLFMTVGAVAAAPTHTASRAGLRLRVTCWAWAASARAAGVAVPGWAVRSRNLTTLRLPVACVAARRGGGIGGFAGGCRFAHRGDAHAGGESAAGARLDHHGEALAGGGCGAGVRFGQRGLATEPDEEMLVLGVSAFMLVGGNR